MSAFRPVKGMVQVGGTTYRIVRVDRARYDVVRILDDANVGTFVTEPRLLVTPSSVNVPDLTEIARHAIRSGRVTWVGRRMEDSLPSEAIPLGRLLAGPQSYRG